MSAATTVTTAEGVTGNASRVMDRREERGAAVVWGVALIGLLVMVAFACATVVGLVAAHRRAQAAADLAALAGAGALGDGESGCPAARDIAGRNHADLTECRVRDRRLGVEVAVVVDGPFGTERRLLAKAVAGPAETAGDAGLTSGW